MKRSVLFLALVLVIAPSLVSAQFTDTLAPVLDGASSSFSPTTIDVTSGAQTVTITLFLTDDLSGVTFTNFFDFPPPSVLFTSPSGAQIQRAVNFTLVSGTTLAGTWQGDVTFPQGAESGTWTVTAIKLVDNVGNTATLEGSTLSSLGFATALEVTSSAADATPPTLVSLTVSPATVDTSTEGQAVTVTMVLRDDNSGVTFAFTPDFSFPLGFFSPVGNFIRGCSEPILTDGTPQDGTWTSSCFVPQYSQEGTWSIYQLTLRDVAGNRVDLSPSDLTLAGFTPSFTLTSTPSDTTPPALSAFTFSPTFIDTSAAAATVTGTASATDDISGFSAIQASLVSPSGGQRRLLFIYQNVSGDSLNGTFTGTADFPQFSEAGTWQIQSLFFYDNVFNYTFLNTAEMTARGFPTVLNVILPSLAGDGQITDGGGTVVDSVFGDRAQLTLPPGAVSEPTDVAIDVLESPLTFPMPTGFAAPGTRFVNISFTPAPFMPFAAPGATVVLPLVDPMPAGTVLVLYRVDPVTGNLAAAVSVNGGGVTGVVGPAGTSATFTGVSQFSVVVGLIPDNVPPVVTPPLNISVPATEAGGARATASAALAAFLEGATAVDNADATPASLAPQVGGADVSATTLFHLGTTTVTFRFRDVAGNIGTATANVTVVLGRPRLVGSLGAIGTPAAGQRTVDVVITNGGTGNARGVKLNQVMFRTLAGVGAVTLASPSLPVNIGGLDVGAAVTVRLTLNVPAGVTRFSISEIGLMKDAAGSSLNFSLSQTVIPAVGVTQR